MFLASVVMLDVFLQVFEHKKVVADFDVVGVGDTVYGAAESVFGEREQVDAGCAERVAALWQQLWSADADVEIELAGLALHFQIARFVLGGHAELPLDEMVGVSVKNLI